jgi:hypothetical protein
LDTQVKKLAAIREKNAGEKRRIDEQVRLNQELMAQMEILREPFDRVADRVDEFSRKLALQDIREFWSPEEAKALTDFAQVHAYFRLKELEMTRKERAMTEELESARDGLDRGRLQGQRQVSELKLENAELRQTIQRLETENATLAEEHQGSTEGIKKALENEQILQNHLHEERKQRQKLETLLARKMAAREIEIKEMQARQKRELKEQLANLQENWAQEKKKDDRALQEEVKRRMTARFERIKDDMVEDEVQQRVAEAVEQERQAKQAFYEEQQATWLARITAQFQQDFDEEKEEMRQQFEQEYQEKLARHAKRKKTRAQQRDLTFHPD